MYAKKESEVWKWHFYDEQYQYNSNSTSQSRSIADSEKEIDLFTWGYDNTSTNNSYSLNPVNTTGITAHTTTEDKQLVYNTVSGDDWGVAYCESNNITVGTWRTLTTAEWQYLFNTRSNASYLYKYGVTVCGKTNCVVLLPDNWEWDETADEHNVGTGWQDEGYPETQTGNEVTWEKMEKAGAVCLPAAGSRYGSNVSLVGSYGCYWSSTANASSAYFVSLYSLDVSPGNIVNRIRGFSVRLITESN